MAKREVVGLGSVWEEDRTFDDLCGLYRWKLEIRQDSGVISNDFTIFDGNGGKFYDGFYSLTSAIDKGDKTFNCDTEDGVLPGQRILIACATTAQGKNAGFSVTGSGTSSSGSLSVTYTPGYSGQLLEWLVKIEVCPGCDDCPDIRIMQNQTRVSDTEYFWGDQLIMPRSGESSTVRRQQPQVAIGQCGDTLDPFADSSLPISLLSNVDIDTATG